MKEYSGWFKAWGTVELPENATEQEIKQALADHLGFDYFISLTPEDIVLDN